MASFIPNEHNGYPVPLVGSSPSPSGNYLNSIYCGIGSLFRLPLNGNFKDDLLAYTSDGPAAGSSMIGLLKDDVNFSYSLTIEDKKSGVPITVKKRFVKEFTASLKASLAELTIASINLFMPAVNMLGDSNSLVVDSYSFVNVNPATGGGIVIHIPYGSISGKAGLNFKETDILRVSDLEIISMGDVFPIVLIS